MLKFLIILLCSAAATHSQIPAVVTLRVAVEAPDLREGAHTVTIRWYDDARAGSMHASEQTTITIISSHATLTLGTSSPLPKDLIERGESWISVQFESAPEPAYRYHITPVAYAQTAGFAHVAASLDPRATGLVTSINEVAGAVELHGHDGITISRQGNGLHLRQSNPREQGIINADGLSAEYLIVPNDTTLLGAHMHCRVVSTEEFIPIDFYYDATAKGYRLRPAAILRTTESIEWQISHR